MKSILTCVFLLMFCASVDAQFYAPGTSPLYSAGNYGINVAPSAFTLEIQGWGQKIRNPGATGYTTLRLYNDQDYLFRTLEIAYSGSTFTGNLLYSGVAGEAASISATGAYPLMFGTANTARMTITAAGSVGIGTPTPSSQFEVASGVRSVTVNNVISGATTGGILAISRPGDGMKAMYFGPSAAPTTDNVIYGGGGGSEMRLVSGGLTSGGFGFYLNMDNSTAFASTRPTSPVLKIDALGNVGIGNNNPDARLAVTGSVHAQEVKVSATVPGPDYVFENGYALPAIDQVELYIGKHKHLPEVPSAKEMEANGIKLGEMNLLLLKKIEELTLYVIELKKENVQQSKEISRLISSQKP